MYIKHTHMVCRELHIHHDLVIDKNTSDNAYSSPLCHAVWNVDHKMVMMGIYLCYNKFSHLCVKIYCNTNQFPSLPFCGPHSKPHGTRGMSKHYHLRFDPRLGHGVCAILCIPCECVVFFLSLGLATEVPKLTYYGVVYFHPRA